jgi:hypothetical protein
MYTSSMMMLTEFQASSKYDVCQTFPLRSEGCAVSCEFSRQLELELLLVISAFSLHINNSVRKRMMTAIEVLKRL